MFNQEKPFSIEARYGLPLKWSGYSTILGS